MPLLDGPRIRLLDRPSERVGGKAANLARLQQHFRVPSFRVLVPEDGAVAAPMAPDEVAGAADALRAEAPGGYLAVRSSADVEDGSKSSYAGLFETRLGVTAIGLPEAVEQVVASAGATRVKEYQSARGLPEQPVRIAVIVQAMVNAERSGVCFTAWRGDRREAIVEAVLGLGEVLVQGEAEPDRFVVTAPDGPVAVTRLGYQHVALLLTPAGLARRPVAPLDRHSPKLLIHEALEVARVSLEIEARLAFAGTDVEWAYDSSGLYVLQARPITAV